jgi:hypothetical protein
MIIINTVVKYVKELCTVRVNTHRDGIYIQDTHLSHMYSELSLMQLNIV